MSETVGEVLYANAGNIMEAISIFLIVLGFFRWYDKRFMGAVKDSKEGFKHDIENIEKATMRTDDTVQEHIIWHSKRD